MCMQVLTLSIVLAPLYAQGLYCCLKETAYEPLATVPCFIVTFGSMTAVVYFYFQVCSETSRDARIVPPILCTQTLCQLAVR